MTDWVLVFVLTWADPPIYTAPTLVFPRKAECVIAGETILPSLGRTRFPNAVKFYCIARSS